MPDRMLRRSSRLQTEVQGTAKLVSSTADSRKRSKKLQAKIDQQDSAEEGLKQPGIKTKSITACINNEDTEFNGSSSQHTRKPMRKKQGGKNALQDPLTWPDRSTSCTKLLGAHVSISGGVDAAWSNANKIGANALAFFVKNQRQWASKPISDEVLSRFQANFHQPLPPVGRGYSCKDHIVVHGTYLVNLANSDADRHKQAVEGYLDDLMKCERLGIGFLNIHPGSTCGKCDRSQSISLIAEAINDGHTKTENVVTLLETMAGRGNLIGGHFEDLGDIIAQVRDKSRIGVCLDTCHVFAAGYDIRQSKDLNVVLAQFDSIIGLKYLKALHLNDSKTDLGSHRDLHENIGFGFIGLGGFHAIMNNKLLDGLPCILETPPPGQREPTFWNTEIRALQMMCGLDADDLQSVRTLLQDRGPPTKDLNSSKPKKAKASLKEETV